MAASNILKSAVSSLTGAIEKAIIETEDERNLTKAGAVEVSGVTARAAVPAGLGGVSGKLGAAAAQAAKAAQTVSAAADIASSVAGAVGVSGLTGALDSFKESLSMELPKKKRFEVKFNPSQITFQGAGGGKVAKTNYSAGGKVDMQYQEMAPRIQMNLQLVFDDYERTEAFMLEKFTDTTAIARTVVSSAASAVTGKKHSVQPQVEGFIGALRNDCTRKVTFYWGSMKYQGVLNHVGAEYTMFSTDGSPIRANVNIGILLTDDSITDDATTNDYMGQWQNSYQQVFEKDGITKLGNAVQGVGNLLNINL